MHDISHTVPQHLVGRTRAIASVAILFVVVFFNTLDRMLIAVLIEPIKADLRLSDSEIGLAVGLLFAICYAGCSIPAARLADRLDRPLLLAIFVSFWSMMTMMMATVNSFAALALVRMGVGAGESGCHPTNHSLVSSYFGPERRARVLGIVGAGGAFGVLFAMIAGGALASVVGWRMTFLIMGAPGLLVALLLWFILLEPRRMMHSDERPRPTPFTGSVKTLLQNPAFVWLTVAAVLCTGGSMGIATWLAAFFMRTYGMPVEMAGFWLGLVSGGAGAIGYVLGGYVSGNSLDPARTVRLPGFFIIVGGLALTLPFLMPDWRLALLLLLPATIVSNFWYSAVFATIQNVVLPENRALASAVTLLAMGSLGNGLGPSLVGFLSDLFAPMAGHRSLLIALLVMAGWIVAGGCSLIMAYRALRRLGPVSLAGR
ncbi:MFS transporter [Sphingobium sp.]|uniref:spinster family MFS transporter n=1 Tax=Sphingobium sp. TaxID=1912891 RepID=UPI002CFF5E25|nr:MFS transporter [Sphingobium sp.]HUD93919.1 MFS transporter [Sphingobium sp.]